MNDDLQIRPAQPDDARVASVLLSSAYTHKQATSPRPEDYEDRFFERLQHFFREDGNRFSYQYTFVAEHASAVVGLVLRWRLEHEAEDDEWYVDALAVLKDWGRKGIGTRLLQTAEQQARQHHYPKIALNVAKDNEEAFSLYQRLHYVVTRETFLYQRRYVRMVKVLDNG